MRGDLLTRLHKRSSRAQFKSHAAVRGLNTFFGGSDCEDRLLLKKTQISTGLTKAAKRNGLHSSPSTPG